MVEGGWRRSGREVCVGGANRDVTRKEREGREKREKRKEKGKMKFFG